MFVDASVIVDIVASESDKLELRAKGGVADCFAYACARSHRVPLLCKGDDFIHTDIEIA